MFMLLINLFFINNNVCSDVYTYAINKFLFLFTSFIHEMDIKIVNLLMAFYTFSISFLTLIRLCTIIIGRKLMSYFWFNGCQYHLKAHLIKNLGTKDISGSMAFFSFKFICTPKNIPSPSTPFKIIQVGLHPPQHTKNSKWCLPTPGFWHPSLVLWLRYKTINFELTLVEYVCVSLTYWLPLCEPKALGRVGTAVSRRTCQLRCYPQIGSNPGPKYDAIHT